MHATSIYIARKQFLRHQTVERTQARSEDFHIRVVRALLHTRVFIKFKWSCTVCRQNLHKLMKVYIMHIQSYILMYTKDLKFKSE